MTKTKPRKRKATSPKPYFESTISIREGYGYKGARPRPFSPAKALTAFQSWAYAAAMLNANAVANVPLRLYSRRGSRPEKAYYPTREIPRERIKYLREGASASVMNKVAEFGADVIEVTGLHPVLRVLKTVNDWQNGYELTVIRMIDLQYSGNSYLHPITNTITGAPDSFWRLPPQRTKVIPSKDNWIAGYLYGEPPEDRIYQASEVIQFKTANPKDDFYGMGWVEAAWKAIAVHDSKREMDQAKFDNMAIPDYIMGFKGPRPKETLEGFKKELKDKYSRAKGRGKILPIDSDFSLQALNINVDEVGTPPEIVEEIAAASGVPVAMLKSNDPTRSSAETARVGWYRSAIRSYCRLDEEKLNEKWVPLFDASEELFVAYDQVSFEDSEAQAKRIIGLVAGGVLTQNEGRAEIGYDPKPDGDRLLPPSGTTAGAAAVAGNLSPGQNDERQNDN